MSKVLVIVVSHNWMPWIDRSISSLVDSTLVPDLYVFDNASTDGTLPYLKEKITELGGKLNVRLVESPDNIGFAQANNQGFDYALRGDYDYIYLLNQDAWIMPDCLEKLVAAAQSNPTYGLLSPLQMNGGMDALDAGFMEHNKRLGGNAVLKSDFFPAAHWLIPDWALRKVGAFSPSFHHYGEDNNWVDRLHYHKLKSGVLPSAKAAHDRACRKRSKDERCHLKCMVPLIRLSNPKSFVFFLKIWAPIWLFGCAVKNFSLIPLKEIPALVRRYPEIEANRRESRSIGAFLSRF